MKLLRENIKTNYIFQSGYQILIALLPLITSPYLARVIGAEGIGIYSYTFAIANYFVIFAKLGIHNYGNRCIASVRDNPNQLNQTFADLYSLHFIISVISILLYIIFIIFFGNSYRLIFIIQGFYLLAQLLDINWFFFGLEKFKITVTRNSIIKLLTVLAIFIFVKDKNDLSKYVFILAFGTALSESVIWAFVKRYIGFVKPNIKSYKKHIGPMFLFFIPSIAVSVYKMMDKIMLGVMNTTSVVGLYENSEKIISICLGFITALGTVMLPRMTNLVANGKEDESKLLIEKSSKFILLLSYSMMFGIIGVSNIFPVVFWGKEFVDCNYLLIGLAVTLPLTAIANVIRTQYLMPHHKDKEFVLSVCMGAIVNIAFNVVLIPKYAAIGAVISTIIAELIVCIVQLWGARTAVSSTRYILWSIPYFVFGCIMSLTVWALGMWLGAHIATLLIQIFVGALLYISVCFGYMYIRKEALIDNVLKKIHR